MIEVHYGSATTARHSTRCLFLPGPCNGNESVARGVPYGRGDTGDIRRQQQRRRQVAGRRYTREGTNRQRPIAGGRRTKQLTPRLARQEYETTE